ncbi:MAG: glutaredoxin 3 [Gammaproteobacteria bacterium]|jgi:glutaredoxin 3
MKHVIKKFVILFLCFIAAPAGAVKVFECQDEQGDRSFQSRCPSGSTIVAEKNISVGNAEKKASGAATPNVTIIFYSIPDCDACDIARIYLTKSNIPHTEKDVSKDIEIQKELHEKTNAASVPVILIGEKAMIGFNRVALKKELETAGFIKPEIKDEETTKE